MEKNDDKVVPFARPALAGVPGAAGNDNKQPPETPAKPAKYNFVFTDGSTETYEGVIVITGIGAGLSDENGDILGVVPWTTLSRVFRAPDVQPTE